jgi:beta-lactamase class A
LKAKRSRKILIALSALFIIVSLLAAGIFWLQAAPVDDRFPAGSTWGGVSIEGLTIDEARELVRANYFQPVTLNYLQDKIVVPAEALGYSADIDQAVSLNLESHAERFWRILWGGQPGPLAITLTPQMDTAAAESFLRDEIAPRYDVAILPAARIPGTTQFFPGQGGYQLDVSASAAAIRKALIDDGQHQVDLIVNVTDQPPVSDDDLTTALKEQIQAVDFRGVAELVIRNLTTGQTIHFAWANQQDVPTGISFSAASTIKIPILTAVMRRTEEPIPEATTALVERMMVLSENPPADTLMRDYLGGDAAPLTISNDMEALGFNNTFLAGFFEFGSPLLKIYDTPANSRSDINLNPDLYNQTTPQDMADLLTGIYQCAQTGSGVLIDTFGSNFSSSKCQFMLDEMKKNRIGALIQAGVPDGTPVGHKHGWTEESDGYLHTVSDVGIVFSPDADFVVSIYLYDYNQLLFDPADALIARLTQTAYNAFNLDQQQDWPFSGYVFPQY